MTIVVYGLAAWYVSYVMVDGVIADSPRAWLMERSEWFALMLSCHRCSSLWAALFVRALWYINRPIPMFDLAGEVLATATLSVLIWEVMEKLNADQQ